MQMAQQIRRTSVAVSKSRTALAALITLQAIAFSASQTHAQAADPQQLQLLLHSGQYEQCVQVAQQAIDSGQYHEVWRLAKIEAELTLGRYFAAADTLEIALRRYASSIPLRWAGFEVYRALGEPQRADRMLAEIDVLVRRSPWNYRDPASRTALGQFFSSQGGDARRVLELFYDRIKKERPDFADAYLAAGELALEKHDYAVAAREFEQALEVAPQNPDVHYGLARAYAPSNSSRAEQAITTALQLNPRHIPCLLLVADREIDAERYAAAKLTLDKVLAINAEHSAAWSAKAAIAHLESRPDDEGLFRRIALGWWSLNPAVDHDIGRTLSEHYRFAEGATYQRRALSMDPNFLPAKVQLSNDLLRLGQDEGWALATEVAEADGYNVVAHNLIMLQQRLDAFRTLEHPPFIVRMDSHEADIYGPDVLALLDRALQQLGPKYQVELQEPVIIEIFPQQQDFAIRTFGLPGGEGFLGVCFGRVITANSPAALRASSTNWHSVLWHEFCHVLTLTKTANKMPRWFSEGLSVYEERQANPAWGEQLTPTYRKMILEGELTPLSQLSSAFMRPKSPLHLQFAYYEASLVIEYLVEQHGFETVLRILDDLGLGMAMNDSLGQRVGSLEVLDVQFAAFAEQRARTFAPDLNWTQPDEPLLDSDDVSAWLSSHPQNFYGLQRQARLLLDQQQWQEARAIAQQLRELCPGYIGPDNPYLQLAEAFRALGDTASELAVLEDLAARDADALEVFLRICELAQDSQDWQLLERNAQRALAVDPLRPAVQQACAVAAEELSKPQEAANAYRALLALQPIDAVHVHFQLARNLYAREQFADARHHLLRALEDAPRFRAAHRLLLDVHRRLNSAEPGPPSPDPQVDQPSTPP